MKSNSGSDYELICNKFLGSVETEWFDLRKVINRKELRVDYLADLLIDRKVAEKLVLPESPFPREGIYIFRTSGGYGVESSERGLKYLEREYADLRDALMMYLVASLNSAIGYYPKVGPYSDQDQATVFGGEILSDWELEKIQTEELEAKGYKVLGDNRSFFRKWWHRLFERKVGGPKHWRAVRELKKTDPRFRKK